MSSIFHKKRRGHVTAPFQKFCKEKLD